MRVLLFLTAGLLAAQTRYDLALKGRHVIDPKNGINGVMDAAVAGGRIARVAKGIAYRPARAWPM
jgi:dihydroorotase